MRSVWLCTRNDVGELRAPSRRLALLCVLVVGLAPTTVRAQQDPNPATVAVHVRHDGVGVPQVLVRSAGVAARTDDSGRVVLRLPAGARTITATKFGYRPESVAVALRAGLDTLLSIAVQPAAADLEAVVVSATRSERRVEDLPIRVEVIDEEEIAEKIAMTPGDIAMMLNETSGLRVQTTSPSLGGANVRIQGLLGRYSLILTDGLPLYGQAGGLGLLQIPPVDLARVEVIKGTASALYGSAALGGVVNLVARRPGNTHERTLLVNQTTRGGSDGVGFLAAPVSDRIGYTLLAGIHRQQRRDLDADGWTDLPGYERVVVRPRLYVDEGRGRTAFVTAGFTSEERRGGTLPGRTTPNGTPFPEGLTTRRGDIGAVARWTVHDSSRALHGAVVSLRGSAVEQRHGHTFGTVVEDDRHRTAFAEASMSVPSGRATYVAGVAVQHDQYRAASVDGYDYSFSVPALFAQLDVEATDWLSASTSARVDAHNRYGTIVSPRVSLLARRTTAGALAGWTTRASVGTGAFAPTPFTEETEVTGLTPLVPLTDLSIERALTTSIDIGGPLTLSAGGLELNATAFRSRVRDAVQVIPAAGLTASGASRIALVNARGPVRTWGAELLGRFVRELGEDGDEGEEGAAMRITGTYTHLRATECDPEIRTVCQRRAVPLTPRHAVGVVAALEQEGRSRVGLELYYTGRQALDENPFRETSRPYLILGALGERAFDVRGAVARVFLNLENLTNVRQTRFDPLRLSARGQGGRWTTDAWTELAGFTVNGGIRLTF